LKRYFAGHYGKPVDEDILQFDITNPVTLDREKNSLEAVLKPG